MFTLNVVCWKLAAKFEAFVPVRCFPRLGQQLESLPSPVVGKSCCDTVTNDDTSYNRSGSWGVFFVRLDRRWCSGAAQPVLWSLVVAGHRCYRWIYAIPSNLWFSLLKRTYLGMLYGCIYIYITFISVPALLNDLTLDDWQRRDCERHTLWSCPFSKSGLTVRFEKEGI